MQPFWYFSLICYLVQKDSHRDSILHILMYPGWRNGILQKD